MILEILVVFLLLSLLFFLFCFVFLKNSMLCCQSYFKLCLISIILPNIHRHNFYQHFAQFQFYEQTSTIIISTSKGSIKRFEAETPTYFEVVLLVKTEQLHLELVSDCNNSLLAAENI